MRNTDVVDPNDFIITRKRKKYKFALFSNAMNCFELDEWNPVESRNLVIEVGSGTGLFLVELAKLSPEKTFIAIDVKADRLQKGARVALNAGIGNIFFVRARADQIDRVVKPGTVEEIWLTFSDPFPKKRDAKRRLTHPKYLEIYKSIHVSKNAHLYLKTDDENFFKWSLEQLVASKWHLLELTFDLHDSSLSHTYKILTTFEKRWLEENRNTMFVNATHKDYFFDPGATGG